MPGKLQLDPDFVQRMERVLMGRTGGATSRPAAAPGKKSKKSKHPPPGRALGQPIGQPAGPEPPEPACKPMPSDLFVVDRQLMESLVDAYVERHLQKRVAAPPAPPAEKQGAAATAAKDPDARFVVHRTGRDGRTVRRAVGASHLRATDRILHMIIE